MNYHNPTPDELDRSQRIRKQLMEMFTPLPLPDDLSIEQRVKQEYDSEAMIIGEEDDAS